MNMNGKSESEWKPVRWGAVRGTSKFLLYSGGRLIDSRQQRGGRRGTGTV